MPEEAIVEQPKETIQSSIDKAKESLVEKPEEKKADNKKEEKKETPPSEDLSPEDLKLATDLFKSLKDPDQAPAIVDWLATKAGYTKAQAKEVVKDLTEGTKVEKAEAKDEIVSLFEEQFGEEFAAKLAPAIKKAIEKGVAEKVKPIEESHQQQQLESLAKEATTIIDDISKEFYEKGEMPKAVETEMSALIDLYPPAKGMSQKDYLRDIHALAAAKKGGSLKPVDVDKAARIERNRNDAPGRMNQGRSPAPDGKQSVDDSFSHIKDPLSKAIAIAKAELDQPQK
jgi:hypothetical protein